MSLKIQLFVETMNCCEEHMQLHISDFDRTIESPAQFRNQNNF